MSGVSVPRAGSVFDFAAGRVPFADGAGLLISDAGFAWDNAAKRLTAQNLRVSTLTASGGLVYVANASGDLTATVAPTDGQLLIGRSGNVPLLGTITAGAGVTITNGAGTIAVAVGGLTANAFVYSGGTGAITATAQATDGQLLIGRTGLAPVAGAISGTANRVTVTLGVGTVTLSAPQDIHSAASPTFAGLTLSAGLTLTGGTVTVSTPILTGTQTWNAGAVTFRGVEYAFTETVAAAAATYLRIRGGAAGATEEFYVQQGGIVYAATAFRGVPGTDGAPTFASSANVNTGMTFAGTQIRLSSNGNPVLLLDADVTLNNGTMKFPDGTFASPSIRRATDARGFFFAPNPSVSSPSGFNVYASSTDLTAVIGTSLTDAYRAGATGLYQFTSVAGAGSGFIDTALGRGAAGLVEVNNGVAGTFRDLKARDLFVTGATYLVRASATLTNGAGVATGTLLNAPVAGDPTKWIAIDDNGTSRKIPAW